MKERETRKKQVIKYGCCGKVFAAASEPYCYTDKEWQKDLRKYVSNGCTVEMVESFEFGNCECKPKEQPDLFNQPNQ